MVAASAQALSSSTHGNRRPRLSRPLVTVAAVSFGAGIASGGVAYAHRSAHRTAHVAGTAAWGPHLLLLLLAVLVTATLVRRGAGLAELLCAPLGSRAAQRLRHTLASAAHHPTAAIRLLIGLLPAALLGYIPWRAGLQILAGLDPNFTANAWAAPATSGRWPATISTPPSWRPPRQPYCTCCCSPSVKLATRRIGRARIRLCP
jgi:hypothetical protein